MFNAIMDVLIEYCLTKTKIEKEHWNIKFYQKNY
jgi:hypothetical protein